MIEWMFGLPQLSTFASDIDNLILMISIFTGFWFFATLGMFFKLIMDSRASKGAKAEYIVGDEKHIKKWISTPHLIIIGLDVFVIIGAIYVWYQVKQNLPPADAEIRVIGQQWSWVFEHPGKDGKLGTPDDIRTVDELHIEVGKTYHYKLQSRDVLHSFSIPVFRMKHDAIPGREITGWFQATGTGEYDIQCAEICGIGHGLMVSKLYIHSAEDYAAWTDKMSARN